jgi:hypothetical protein
VAGNAAGRVPLENDSQQTSPSHILQVRLAATASCCAGRTAARIHRRSRGIVPPGLSGRPARRPRPTIFFAYDPGDAFETLEHAARRVLDAGFTCASHCKRAYVLIGYPNDAFAAAEQRLQQMLALGFTPHAVLWRPETPSQMKHAREESWRAFQRHYNISPRSRRPD